MDNASDVLKLLAFEVSQLQTFIGAREADIFVLTFLGKAETNTLVQEAV